MTDLVAVDGESSGPRVAACVRSMAPLGLAQHLEAVTEELRLLDDELREAKRERQQLQVTPLQTSTSCVSN